VAGARANSDLDNHAKMIVDALQDSGVIASDDVRVVRELVVRTVDGEARTEVTIRRMEA
jgi:Holliday junction resolvase RusA-like endonuclease